MSSKKLWKYHQIKDYWLTDFLLCNNIKLKKNKSKSERKSIERFRFKSFFYLKKKQYLDETNIYKIETFV